MINVEPGQIWFKTDIGDHFYLIDRLSKFDKVSEFWISMRMESGQECNIWIYTDIDKLISGADIGK